MRSDNIQGGFVVGSAHLAWPDPPWRITGRTLTAWFPVPDSVLEGSLPWYLRPVPGEPLARLRFYDARFQTRSERIQHPLVSPAGAFREAVVAFPVEAGGLEGDATMFMWADDDAYRSWGREVFGWPVLPGTVELQGTLWDTPIEALARGSARLTAPAGTAVIRDVTIHDRIEPTTTTGGWWLTPRRIHEHVGGVVDREEVVAARPRVIQTGVSCRATGAVEFDFAEGHPLHGLRVRPEKLVVVDGFELLVAADVVVRAVENQ